MKKLLLGTALFLVAVVGLNAQTTFGAKAGLNLANVTGEEVKTKAKIGLVAGVFAEVSLGEDFRFQPELLFSSQGYKIKDLAKASLNYVSIPLMAKYYVAEGFALEAGPQIGILLSAKAKSGKEEVDMKKKLKSTDFGLNIGASYDVIENMFVGARYNFGLSKLAKGKRADKVKNSVLSVSLGYRF